MVFTQVSVFLTTINDCYVIVMLSYVTACQFIWNESADRGMNATTIGELTNAVTVNECKDACRKDPDCSSVDMTRKLKVLHCWLYPYPYDASLMHAAPRVTHYIINRSSKTVKRCFSEYDGKWTDDI